MIILVSNLSSLGVKTAKILQEAQLLDSIIWQKNVSRRPLFRRSLGWIRSWIQGRNNLSFGTLTRRYQILKLKKSFPGRFVTTENINESDQVSVLLQNTSATSALVVGGRILSPRTIAHFDGEWLNLHGGILPEYRGLDSEYWATKECDYKNIGFTLHRLTADIDQGEILSAKALKVDAKKMTLKKVIKLNEENGLELIRENIVSFGNFLNSRNSGGESSFGLSGRYFSSAPKNVNFRLKLSKICNK